MPKSARALVVALAALTLTLLAPASAQALSSTVPATASGATTAPACAGCWP